MLTIQVLNIYICVFYIKLTSHIIFNQVTDDLNCLCTRCLLPNLQINISSVLYICIYRIYLLNTSKLLERHTPNE